MGKKGYALVEAVTAVALVMMASGILSLGISFGLRMERRAEQLKDTDTVQEVPARFRMRTWDGTVISGEGCVRRQTVTGRNRELFIYGFGMKGTRGFTLVELMAAAMLAGAALLTALPLMLMAQRTARRLSGETAAAMRGDAVFELAAGELRYAESVSLSEKPWNRIDGDTFGSFSDVEIGIRAAGERSLWLTVRVNQGEELLYERTGRVELLNVPFYGTGRLEGSGRTGQSAAEGASYPAVWYIDGGDS